MEIINAVKARGLIVFDLEIIEVVYDSAVGEDTLRFFFNVLVAVAPRDMRYVQLLDFGFFGQ